MSNIIAALRALHSLILTASAALISGLWGAAFWDVFFEKLIFVSMAKLIHGESPLVIYGTILMYSKVSCGLWI